MLIGAGKVSKTDTSDDNGCAVCSQTVLNSQIFLCFTNNSWHGFVFI